MIAKSIINFMLTGILIMSACSESTEPLPDETDYYIANSSIDTAGTKMYYSVAVPRSYKATTDTLPLVLALHYGGTPTSTYGRDLLEMLVIPGLGELNAIMAAPVTPVERTWTNSTCRTAIFALLDKMKEDYSIDESRMLVTGYSMGAIGTWYYAAFYPNIFSAAVAVSGMPDQAAINQFGLAVIPMYVIHSRMDQVFPYDAVETLVNDLKTEESDITLKTVEDLTHYQTGSFAKYLRTAVPWLHEKWDE